MKNYAIILNAEDTGTFDLGAKKHCITASLAVWTKRFNEIQAGTAYISLYVKTFGKKKHVSDLKKEDGIGLEVLKAPPGHTMFARVGTKAISWQLIAKNEGVPYDTLFLMYKDKPAKKLAIIHLTSFRYE